MKCFHCGHAGHVIKDCRKLKKLQELKERLDKGGTITSKDGRVYFSKEQKGETQEGSTEEDEYEAIQFTLMQLPKWTNKPTTNKEDWIFDGAATQHITNNIKDFVKGSLRSVRIRMKVGNGETVKIKQAGLVNPKDKNGNQLSPRCQLTNVLYMPQCPVKLISEPTLDVKGAVILKRNGELVVYNQGKRILMRGTLTPTKLYRLENVDGRTSKKKAKIVEENYSQTALLSQSKREPKSERKQN